MYTHAWKYTHILIRNEMSKQNLHAMQHGLLADETVSTAVEKRKNARHCLVC